MWRNVYRECDGGYSFGTWWYHRRDAVKARLNNCVGLVHQPNGPWL